MFARPARVAVALLFALVSLLQPAIALAQSITSYTLISETRPNRTDAIVTYRVTLTNPGPALQSATATASTAVAGITILDADVSFGPVPAGGTAQSTDTFQFRINRTQATLTNTTFSWVITPGTGDTVPPTVTINQAVGQADPTSLSPILFTVAFSEPVTGFASNDISLAGSTIGGTLVASVSGSGASYTVSVTGMTGTGTVVAAIPAGAALDAASNPSGASTSTDNTVTFVPADTTSPTVTINQAAGQADPTNLSPILFTVVFSEPVTGFASNDISLTGSTVGGTLVASVSGSGASYTVSVTGMTGTGTVVAAIPAGAAQDATSNPSAASTSTDNTVTFDNVGPTVTINQAAGQADPTNASPILFSVVFSEAVTGFSGSDISLTGSTVAGTLVASVSGSGANYTVSVTGMNGTGTVVAAIPAGGALDAVGNGNGASTSTDNTVTFDNVGPTVTINQAAAQADPTNASPILFSVVFSEAVTGFSGSDINLTGSTVAGTLVANVSGSGATYTVSVTGMNGVGTVVASIPAGAAQDAASNASAASTSTDNTVTFDNVGPTVTINQAAGQVDPTSASPILFTVVFSEAITGFSGSDINLTTSTAGGTLVASVGGSGANYTVSVTGMTSDGTIVASVAAGAAQDAASNPSAASTSTDNTVTFAAADTTPPTVTINQAAAQADPTNASPILFSVVFSEAVTGFSGSDISLTGSTVGGTLVASVSGSGANYTVSVTGMNGTGTVVAAIPAGGALDAAGNGNGASTSTDNTVTFDNVGPTVTINQAAAQADPTNASPILFSVVFSEAVTGFAASDVSFTGSTIGGTLVASVSGSGANYTVSVTGMNGTGTVVASIPVSSASDAAGNTNAASTSTDNTVTFDNVAPTVTINQAASQADPTSASPILFTVVFSEPVTGFASNDISLTGSTVGGTLVASVSGSGASYTVSVTGMTGTGTVVAAIPAGAAQDATSNPSAAATSTDNTVTFDNVGPTVTINQAAGQADPTNASPILFSVVFSEAVTGFSGSDISLTGSTVGGTLVASVSGSGANYTVSVTGMNGTGTVVAAIPAGGALDAAGNGNGASTSTDNSVTFDNVAPTVTINQAAAQADPTNASPILFSVVFSEAVTGFSGSDISLTGSTVGGTLVASVSGSGATYTVSVTGMNGTGTVVAAIPGGAAQDAANNSSAASTSTDNSVTFNAAALTVTINQAAAQADPTNASPIQFTVAFSAAVTGFTSSDVNFTGSTVGGTLVANVSGSGATYTVSVTGMNGVGTVVASIPAGAAQDAASNLSEASSSTDNTVTFDNVAPTVTINQAVGQADPTNASPILFTVVFSEAVTGFSGSDISLTGSTVGGTLVASVSGSGANYTVSVTGMNGTGTVVASIPAGGALDAAGNGNGASTSTDNSVTFDNVAPTVTINQAAAQADPTNASPILFSVVFSEAVTGFAGSDISFTGSTVGGTLVASVSGSGATYTVSVTGMNGTGTVVASIPASSASDAAGNTNTASTSTDNSVTFDNVAPTVTINQAAAQADPTNASPILFSVVFSEAVTGFTGSDISFTGSTIGGTLVASVSGSGATYTVSVTGMNGTGTVVASIPVSSASDAAGNTNAASTSTDNTVTFDNVTPTVTINQAAAQADPTNASPILFSVVFSEAVTGFTGSDISFTGSTIGGTLVASVSGSGASYTVSVTGMNGTGTVVASIPVSSASDAAGNTNAAATSTDNTVTFDNVAPTVTINQAVGQADPTNASPILLSVVFSEAVTGFTGSDISFTGSTVGGTLVASVSGSGASYTVSVTGMNGTGTVVASIPVSSASDAAGNTNAAATSTDNSVTFDNVAPTVTINQAVGQADPTNASPIQFTVVFSESVTGFASSDISFTGSTVGGTLVASIAGSGANYTVSVTGMNGYGTVVASIPAGSASDATGNTSVASTSTDNTVLYDNIGPSPTINRAAGQADPTNASPIQFTVVFDEPVFGFTNSDISFSGSTTPGTLVASLSGSGPTYTVTVTGMAGNGDVIASIPAGAVADAASNPNVASTAADNVVAYDIVPPTVTIDQAAAQPDPTNASPVQFTVVFSEPVFGFSNGDVDLSSSTVGGTLVASVTGSGTTYTVSVTGMNGVGTIVATVPATAATDAAGNSSGAATSTDNSVSFDAAGPRVISSTPSGIGPGPIDRFTLTFSEPILAASFTLADVVSLVGPNATPIAPTAVNPLNSTQFDVVFPSQTNVGGYSLVLGPSVLDLAGNPMDQNSNGTTGEPVNDRYTAAFTLGGAATLILVNPSSGAQGVSNLPVAVTGQFTTFVNGTTTAGFSGTGISVNSVTVDSPTSATLNITISAIAPIGARSLTFTTGTEIASSSVTESHFTVTAGPAALLSITPNQGHQAESLVVDLVGHNTHFANGTTTLQINGVSLLSTVVVNSPTSATAHIAVGSNAALGAQNVSVVTGGEVASLVSGFTILAGVPQVLVASPQSGRQAKTLDVTLSAQFTHFVNGTTTASFGSGITVNTVTVTSPVTAIVNITIDKTATLGPRTVTMTTGAEIAQGAGVFTVLQGLPALASITPVAGTQGTSATVVLNGAFTHFGQGVTTASFGPGITIGSVTVNGPELASVPITITESASIGPRDVTVTTGGESVALTGGFTVLQGTPAVTIIDPNAAQRGITRTVNLTGIFTNWINGVTSVSYGAGITVNSNNVSDPTHLTNSITIDPGAALGPRTVVVTTGTEIETVDGGFTVTDVDTTPPAALQVSPQNGAGGVPLNVVPTIEWNEPLDRNTITAGSFRLVDSATGQFVPGTVSLDVTGRILTFQPSRLLAVNRGHYLYFPYEGVIEDVAGNNFTSGFTSFTTGFTTETTGPTLVLANPRDGDTGIGTNAPVSLQFDHPINPATRAAGVQITSGGSPIPGTFTYEDGLRRVRFVPATPFGAGTTVTVTLSSQLTDIAGNGLTNPGSLSFTLANEADTIGPLVTSNSPVYGDTGVGLSPIIRIYFSEAVNPISVTPSGFFLVNNNFGIIVPTAITIAPDRKSLTMVPTAPLLPFTSYYYQGNSFIDLAGNGAGNSAFVYFTTANAADVTPPAVVSVSPPASTTDVPVNARIQVMMSELIDVTSMSGASLQISPAVAGTSGLQGDRVTVKFTPSGLLTPSTVYTITLNGLRDASGNTMAPFESTFTTAPTLNPDNVGPTVLTFTPANSSTNVALDAQVTMLVSEPIDPLRVGSNSMRVYANLPNVGGVQVAGTYQVTNGGTQVIFTPSGFYPTGTVMTVYSNYDQTITDLAGNTLQYTAVSFTTAGAPPDTTSPIVVAVTPTDGSASVGPNAPITLAFSESINPNTPVPSFAVFAGPTQVGIGVTRSADNRMVILSGGWPLNTLMTVVATADNLDLSGNRLVPFSSTFTTAASYDSTRASVITQLPTGSGVAANTSITLYLNKALNAATVPGALYISQNGILVDGTVTVEGGGTAVRFVPEALFLENAVIQVFFTASASDLSGNPINPYSGQFTIGLDPATHAPVIVRTTPAMYSGNNPRNAVIEVEFSEALDPDTVTPASFYVRNSLNQDVAGTRTLENGGRTIKFVPDGPVAINDYEYVNLTNALKDMQGEPFAGTNYYFYVNTTIDTTAPTVTSVGPANGLTGIGVNSLVRVGFSEAMDALSLTTSSVTLSSAGGPVPVTISFPSGNASVRIAPQVPLAANTLFTLTIVGATDVAGNALAALSSSFTAGPAADTTAPSVIAASFFTGQGGVPINAALEMTFSEPMDVPTVLASQTTLVYDTRTGLYVPGTFTVSPDARTFTFVPSTPLAVNRGYYFQVSSGIDLAGNGMFGYFSHFVTDFAADTTPPTVAETNPVAGQTSVPRNLRPQVLFSETIAGDTMPAVQLLLNGNPVPVTRTLSANNRQVTLAPNTLLAPNTTYTISVATSLRDAAGNPLAAPFTSTFTTGADADLYGPQVVTSSPFPSETNLPLDVVIRFVFSEPVNPLSVNGTTFLMYNILGQPIVPTTLTLSADRRMLSMKPVSLLPSSTYYVQANGFTDAAGNGGSYTAFYLTTGDQNDTSAPTVLAVWPPAGVSGVPVNARVTLSLSERIDPTSVAGALQFSPSVAGSVAIAGDHSTLTFTPASPLTISTTYSMTVTGLRDYSGNVMAPFQTTFTTSGSIVGDTAQPTTVTTDPASGATGVAVNSSIVVTVSEPIRPGAVGPQSFAVSVPAGRVAGTYSVDPTNTIITFTPVTPFPANSTVTFAVNQDSLIVDYAGNPLVNNGYSFTTGSTADVTPPSLISVTPPDGTTNLGPYTTITLAFSESLNPGTVHGNSLALFAGSSRVGYSFSRSADNRMLFVGGLSPGTTYTLFLTSDILDMSANPFAGTALTLTTAPFDATNPNIISQRPTGSGVTIGSAITLFADSAIEPATVPGGLFVSQNGVLVPGTVVLSAGNRAIRFTPNVPFAPGALVEIALTTAVKDPSGNPISAYYGSFIMAADTTTTAPLIVATSPGMYTFGVLRNAVIDVQFNEPLNAATVTPATMYMRRSDGTTPIAGTVSLHNGNRTIRFTPDAPLTASDYVNVYVTSGVQDTQGMAFSGFNYYLYAGVDTDTMTPTVLTIAPPNGITGVGVNAVASIQFSEPVNMATVNTTTVSMTSSGAIPIAISASGDNRTIFVTPQVPLPVSATVIFTVDGVQDLAGNQAATASTTFTTGAAPDTTASTVVSVSPFYGESGVPVNAVIEIRFSEPMQPGSLQSEANTLLLDTLTSTYVTGGTVLISSDLRTMTYTPAANLTPSRTYYVQVSGNSRDLSGNPGNGVFVVFTTSSATDTTAPAVVVVTPADGAVSVPRNARVAVRFSEPIRPTSIDQIQLLENGVPLPVTRTMSDGNRAVVLTPSGPLAASTVHQISLAGVFDIAGNALPAQTTTFTTGLSVDLVQPSGTVITSPGNFATGVPTSVTPTVTFSEAMDAVNVWSSSGLQLRLQFTQQVVPVTFSFSADRKTVTLTPVTPLESGTQYQLVITSSLTDLSGNPYPTTVFVQFSTQ